MSDVFISYSRRDIDFVRHLFDQLIAHDHEPWADWLAEIYRSIEAANTFLFVISPDSVISEVCMLEIEHAVKHNKRLIPVVWKDMDDILPAITTEDITLACQVAFDTEAALVEALTMASIGAAPRGVRAASVLQGVFLSFIESPLRTR